MGKKNSYLALIIVLVIAIAVLTQSMLKPGSAVPEGSQLIIQLQTSAEVPEISDRVMERVLAIMEKRVEALGLSKSAVQSLAEERILLQLPKVADLERVERVLLSTAQLDFREQLPGTEEQFPIELQVRRQLLVERELLPNSGDEEAIAKNAEALRKANEAIAQFYKEPTLSSQYIEDAFPEPIAGGENWGVGIVFSSEGGMRFADLTKNIAGTGRTIGIFLDDRLISAPTVGVEFVETGITGGRAVIQGRFSAQEAEDLAVQLTSGPLPVPIEILEKRILAPEGEEERN